jgi:ribosome-binding protein aMBF1 (putative translation factor)
MLDNFFTSHRLRAPTGFRQIEKKKTSTISLDTTKLHSKFLDVSSEVDSNPARKKTAMFIRQKRRALGLTQERLAKRIGVTKAAVSSWELGKFSPTPRIIPKLARALGVDPDSLERSESDHAPQQPGLAAA